MESAGRAVATTLLEHYPDAAERGIVILCGKGHNGGDGLAAARLAEDEKQWDLAIKIYSRLVSVTPALQTSLNRKIDKARDQLRVEKN